VLQALLTERFKMVTHKETKEQPVYALVVGNPGRLVGWMCQCGVKLAAGAAAPAQATCGACGSQYNTDASGRLIRQTSE